MRRLGCPTLATRRLSTAAAATLAIGVAAACSDTREPGIAAPRPTASALRAALTPAAAASLDVSGQFPLAGPSGAGPYPELSGTDALAAARAWVHTFAPQIRSFLERIRGGPVDVLHLAPCGRPLYARAAFTTPDSAAIPAPVRRVYGPWWLVTLCAGGTPEVSLAVSAWATEMRVVGNTFVFPQTQGNEFFPIGIPLGHSGEYPTSPEAAAAVAKLTGRHVAAVPELVMQAPTGGIPQSARWVIRLETPAPVKSRGRGILQVGEVHVRTQGIGNLGLRVLTPTPGQPTTTPISWITLPHPGEASASYQQRRKLETAVVGRRADTPLSFETVAPTGGQNAAITLTYHGYLTSGYNPVANQLLTTDVRDQGNQNPYGAVNAQYQDYSVSGAGDDTLAMIYLKGSYLMGDSVTNCPSGACEDRIEVFVPRTTYGSGGTQRRSLPTFRMYTGRVMFESRIIQGLWTLARLSPCRPGYTRLYSRRPSRTRGRVTDNPCQRTPRTATRPIRRPTRRARLT